MQQKTTIYSEYKESTMFRYNRDNVYRMNKEMQVLGLIENLFKR